MANVILFRIVVQLKRKTLYNEDDDDYYYYYYYYYHHHYHHYNTNLVIKEPIPSLPPSGRYTSVEWYSPEVTASWVGRLAAASLASSWW